MGGKAGTTEKSETDIISKVKALPFVLCSILSHDLQELCYNQVINCGHEAAVPYSTYHSCSFKKSVFTVLLKKMVKTSQHSDQVLLLKVKA